LAWTGAPLRDALHQVAHVPPGDLLADSPAEYGQHINPEGALVGLPVPLPQLGVVFEILVCQLGHGESFAVGLPHRCGIVTLLDLCEELPRACPSSDERQCRVVT